MIFESRVSVDATPAEAFAWHARRGAFERLSPPWERVDVVAQRGTIRDGDELELRMRLGVLPVTWLARHRDFVDGVSFTDEQLRGPFRRWVHTHRIEPSGDGAELVDSVDYELPFGAVGRLVAGGGVRRRLERMFAYRRRVFAGDMRRHLAAKGRRMKIAISGASGVVGVPLCAFLTTGGHEVIRLVRRGGDGIRWDPAAGTIDAAALEGVDAVVHLAAENIGVRWTPERKISFVKSRVDGTTLLATTIAKLGKKPTVFVSASAVGYYGTDGAPATEDSPAGSDFLAQLCQKWEAATQPAVEAGIRVVTPRLGVVLTPSGGALKKLLPPFRAGLGGRVGSGKQMLPWVALDDALGALLACITDERLRGAVNIVAPNSVSQRDFATTLAQVLHRPSFFPLPGAVVRALFGEMGVTVLLGGRAAIPTRLQSIAFAFQFPSLEPALRHMLGRSA